MVKKPPALRLQRRPTAKTTGLLDKFKVSKLPVGVGVPSATVTSGEGRSEQLEHTRDEKVERNKKPRLAMRRGSFNTYFNKGHGARFPGCRVDGPSRCEHWSQPGRWQLPVYRVPTPDSLRRLPSGFLRVPLGGS